MIPITLAWLVPSSRAHLPPYKVTRGQQGYYCPCPGFASHKHCRHVYEAHYYMTARMEWGTPADPFPIPAFNHSKQIATARRMAFHLAFEERKCA